MRGSGARSRHADLSRCSGAGSSAGQSARHDPGWQPGPSGRERYDPRVTSAWRRVGSVGAAAAALAVVVLILGLASTTDWSLDQRGERDLALPVSAVGERGGAVTAALPAAK